MNKTPLIPEVPEVKKFTEREKFSARHIPFLAGLPTRTPEQELLVALSRVMPRNPRQESEFKTMLGVAYAEEKAKRARIRAQGIIDAEKQAEKRKDRVAQRKERARELIQDGLLLRELMQVHGLSKDEIAGGCLLLANSIQKWRGDQAGQIPLTRLVERGQKFLDDWEKSKSAQVPKPEKNALMARSEGASPPPPGPRPGNMA
jgi:hypothetical protein